jgi:hypothetical protein
MSHWTIFPVFLLPVLLGVIPTWLQPVIGHGADGIVGAIAVLLLALVTTTPAAE